MKRIPVCKLALFVVLTAGAAASAHAQQKAYWVPISDNIVQMEVRVPEGRWVTVSVLEGDQARITDRDLNLSMAFVPVLERDHVKIRAFRVDTHPSGDESAHWIEDMKATVGGTTSTQKTSAAFAVKVLSVVKAPASEDTTGKPAPRPTYKPNQ